MMKRVTRADVAKRAGTSTAVVSWVLNNGPRPVAPMTRQRVLRAVEELGYEPNLIARALRAQRTNTLGCIVPNSANPFYSEIARSIERAAFERNLVVLLGNVGYGLESEEQYLRTFSNLRVDGLLLVHPDLPAEFEAPPVDPDLPHVYVYNHAPTGTNATSVLLDMESAGRLATEHLLEHGHREVACLTGPSRSGALGGAIKGWRQTLSDAGLRRGDDLEHAGGRGHFGGYEFAMKWLRRSKRPTALFAVTDGHALGVLRAARELGVRVPEDLAIASCNGTVEASFSFPPLTTACHPMPSLGTVAVDTLGQIQRTGQPLPDVRLDMSLRLGASCGCPAPTLTAGSK